MEMLAKSYRRQPVFRRQMHAPLLEQPEHVVGNPGQQQSQQDQVPFQVPDAQDSVQQLAAVDPSQENPL